MSIILISNFFLLDPDKDNGEHPKATNWKCHRLHKVSIRP